MAIDGWALDNSLNWCFHLSWKEYLLPLTISDYCNCWATMIERFDLDFGVDLKQLAVGRAERRIALICCKRKTSVREIHNY